MKLRRTESEMHVLNLIFTHLSSADKMNIWFLTHVIRTCDELPNDISFFLRRLCVKDTTCDNRQTSCFVHFRFHLTFAINAYDIHTLSRAMIAVTEQISGRETNSNKIVSHLFQIGKKLFF